MGCTLLVIVVPDDHVHLALVGVELVACEEGEDQPILVLGRLQLLRVLGAPEVAGRGYLHSEVAQGLDTAHLALQLVFHQLALDLEQPTLLLMRLV